MPQLYFPSQQPGHEMTGQPARITIFVGAYGSGKSEVSVNFALWLARTVRKDGQRVILCDLDMINPYYRSADARALLADNQIELVASMYANTNVDVPSLPPQVFSVFDNPDVLAVLDIGGEDLGARVVGSLRNRLAGEDFALNLVVNPYRPMTGTPEGIAQAAAEIESATGLRLHGVVDNANLLEVANRHLIEESYPIVTEGARLAGLPVLFAATMEVPEVADGTERSDVAMQADVRLDDSILVALPVLNLVRSIHYPTDR
ncbi:MAG: hypothetical protein PHQ83_08985 [Eubacteriales bacterium]|nr:hypothetical protein [Eubacteriales bacterium]